MKNSYWFLGTRLSILADHTETGGKYDLIEGSIPPRTQPPPHRHASYSEQLYVLEGEITIWIGDRKVVLGPGENFMIPAGAPHVVAVTGDRPGRGLVVASPSGFAPLISAVGTPDEGGETPPSNPIDMDLFLRVSAEIGDELLGPPGALPG